MTVDFIDIKSIPDNYKELFRLLNEQKALGNWWRNKVKFSRKHSIPILHTKGTKLYDYQQMFDYFSFTFSTSDEGSEYWANIRKRLIAQHKNNNRY